LGEAHLWLNISEKASVFPVLSLAKEGGAAVKAEIIAVNELRTTQGDCFHKCLSHNELTSLVMSSSADQINMAVNQRQ
jgi:hypothetical protein